MTLRDRDGVVHIAVRPNDADAWWTPIACGEGICLPGTQRSNRDQPPTCAICKASALTRKQRTDHLPLEERP